jgi:hypothetical protein
VAEKRVVVCDMCGEPAVETVTMEVRGRVLNKDLCQEDLDRLTADGGGGAGQDSGPPPFYLRVVRSPEVPSQ